MLHCGAGPGERAEVAEEAILHLAQLDLREHHLHLGVELAAVSGATHDEAAVVEDVAQDVGAVALADVVHGDVAHAAVGEGRGDVLSHLFGVAVHAAVDDRHAVEAFVAAEAVVEGDHIAALPRPDGAVGGADGVDLKPGELLECALHGGAVLADDVCVVARHLAPEAVGVHIGVEHAAVQGAKRAEGVGREEHLLRLLIRDHDLGPVHHRSHVERELVVTQVERVALLDLVQPVGDAVISGQHAEGLFVADDLHIGIDLAQQADAAGVVRLHVIDHQIVQLAAVEQLSHALEEEVGIADVDRIDQHGLVVDDQIRVVGHAPGERPQVFKQCFLAIVYAYVINVFRNSFHDGSCFLLMIDMCMNR